MASRDDRSGVRAIDGSETLVDVSARDGPQERAKCHVDVELRFDEASTYYN
jgi:hypothetical protein